MRKLILILICMLLVPAAALAQEGLWFSHESGFYLQEIDLEILCDDPEADIYYTLDGTTPTEEDGYYYDEPFHLEDRTPEDNELSAFLGVARGEHFIPRENVVKGHVIRAVAVYPNGNVSEILNGTFFIGIDREAHYGSVPVVSLMVDEYDLFDFDEGIYVLGRHFVEWESELGRPYEDWETQGNYSLRGSDWERPVTVQFLPADGSEGFDQAMGLRIKGGVSRSAVQKSLRLIARDQYGEKQLKYPVFPGNLRADGTGEVAKYKSVTLRNGGNDNEFARIRDPLFQRLAEGMDFMVQATRPCVCFINGEYWGVYTITEEYSDHAIENNYGVANRNVITIKNGRVEDGLESDIAYYEEMFDFIAKGDMTDPAQYQRAGEMLDLPGFAQYCALQLYIQSEDCLLSESDNNWQMWRTRDPEDNPYADGQWRMMLFDTDYSSDVYGDGRDHVRDNITPAITNDGSHHTDRHPQQLFYSLYQNEDFRREFILAMCDVRNINFRMPHAGEVLRELRAVYEPLMPEHYRRFGPEWVVLYNMDTHYKSKLGGLNTFLMGRYERFPYVVRKALGLKYPVEAAFSVNDHALGRVQINRTLLPQGEDVTGLYFTEYAVTATAIPAEGHRFVGWQTNAALDDPASATVTVTFTDDFSLQAVFE